MAIRIFVTGGTFDKEYAINGMAFEWNRVRKNRQTGYFEAT
jgi:hypothetical protein